MALDHRRKAGLILGAFIVYEGAFVAWGCYPSPARFLRYLGFLPGRHTPSLWGWAAALVVTVFFVWRSSKLPSVRASMFVPDGLKLLAIGVGVAAGILEEWLFRGILMDWLAAQGLGAIVQVAVSGLSFGLMHAVWAFFKGSWRAGFTATLATGALGIGLALVYLAGGRSLAPCIVAHFWVDALCEPGLMLAAVRGEMGRALPAQTAA